MYLLRYCCVENVPVLCLVGLGLCVCVLWFQMLNMICFGIIHGTVLPYPCMVQCYHVSQWYSRPVPFIFSSAGTLDVVLVVIISDAVKAIIYATSTSLSRLFLHKLRTCGSFVSFFRDVQGLDGPVELFFFFISRIESIHKKKVKKKKKNHVEVDFSSLGKER